MSHELPFDPFPFIDNPHRQTVMSSILNFLFEPVSESQLVRMVDGDYISLEVTTPKDWKGTDLTVVFVHGLCGSHKSSYLVRMARALEPLGIRVIRLNMRGCGSGEGLARHLYHHGFGEDVFGC